MTLQPILINGSWQQAYSPVGSFTAINPATKTALKEIYPVSSFTDVDMMLTAAQKTIMELRSVPTDFIADFLEAFANNIEFRKEEIIEKASLETALPQEPRLSSQELPRTTNQLRQAAAAVRDRSWCQATIDTKVNIRSKYGPLNGPILIIGPNNFPLAFNSISGGDFAAAIAAGNPIIAKANPGHPGTTKILAEAAFEAIKRTGLPPAMVQLFYHLQPEDGLKLVAHPRLGATAFTGSRTAGLKIKEAADRAGKPIYLEMSSLNPVFILPGALQERLEEIAKEFFNSCTLGTGQFCTKPGLVILGQDKFSKAFLKIVKDYFQLAPAGILLSNNVLQDLKSSIKIMKAYGAEILTGGQEIKGKGYRFANTLICISGNVFLKNIKFLQIEAFGPSSLFVFAEDKAQIKEIASKLDGSLTASIYSHSKGKDDQLYEEIEPFLRQKVGRLLNDKMPTGVAVSPAMNHGGPFPATGHPGFTAVGIPASMLRFSALHCYDNVRPHRLPLELQDKNPTGHMWRFINGQWTTRDVFPNK